MKKVIFSILCVVLIGFGFLFRLVDSPTHAQDSVGKVDAHGPPTMLIGQTPTRSLPLPQFSTVQAAQSPPVSRSIRSRTTAQRPVRKISSESTWAKASPPIPELPPNAQQIKSLVRANYTLSRNVAETMEKLFALDKNKKVETNIIADEKADLVQLQVTTDEQTQRSVAEFLNNVYPKPDIYPVQAAASHGHIQVSLKLPEMTCLGCVNVVRNSLTSIGATEFEADLATNTCRFSLAADVNVESQMKIVAKKTQHFHGWSIAK